MKRPFVWLGIAIALIGADRLMAGPEPIETKDYKAAPAPIVEPMCRWTGFWIGLHGGYGWGDASLEEFDDEDPAFHHTQEGFVGGGQAGFNLQLGGWFVIGVEGDFAGSDISESTRFTFEEEPDETTTLHTDIDWIGSIGGRIGTTFCHNRFFGFFKGGVAFISGDDHIREVDEGSKVPEENFHHDFDETTGYVGGGLEYAMTCHWSLMFEYKHYFLDDDNITGHIQETDEEKMYHREHDLDSVLFGVNYKF